MRYFSWALVILVIYLLIHIILGCTSSKTSTVEKSTQTAPLRGACSYTPYDSFAMLWARQDKTRSVVWVASGGEAGRLLISRADPARRPDWIFCSQGVVAGLAAKGEDVVIIASTYVSGDVILPIYRLPRKSLEGSRSLYIPRSSIEVAFDRLLNREGVSRDKVKTPAVDAPSFSTITSLLGKPSDSPDALDFAVLVEPFITNLLHEHPGKYEVGQGDLYDLHYSVVVRRDDLAKHRGSFVQLLRDFVAVEIELQAAKSEEDFRSNIWGRTTDGKPELLPSLETFDRAPLKLQLHVSTLRARLRQELEFLTGKYPGELAMPSNVDALVDASVLQEAAPERVVK